MQIIKEEKTKFDKIVRQILTVSLVSIYPQTCGMCGKIHNDFICSKCNLLIKKEQQERDKTNKINDYNNEYFDELFFAFHYYGFVRDLILRYKFQDEAFLYKMFANFLLKNKKIFENIKKYDTIMPVPISDKRFKERGYNQSFLIAKELARLTDLELVNNCLIKTKNIIEQSKLNKEDREKNIFGVYKLQNSKLIENRRILLLDDIYTTGSTVNECSRILLQGNPKKISVVVIAKD